MRLGSGGGAHKVLRPSRVVDSCLADSKAEWNRVVQFVALDVENHLHALQDQEPTTTHELALTHIKAMDEALNGFEKQLKELKSQQDRRGKMFKRRGLWTMCARLGTIK